MLDFLTTITPLRYCQNKCVYKKSTHKGITKGKDEIFFMLI